MFAVCGEALFDVFATSETSTGLTLDARIGGSPFNVAVGLRRLGQPAALVTRLSTGFLGDRLLKALEAEGVDTFLIERGPEPTTLSLVGVDPQGVPSYAFYGHGCADRLLSTQVQTQWPDSIQGLHVGSYATVVGQTAATQRRLVEQVQGRVLVSYDPNVRLNVEPRLSVWIDQLHWMLPRTDLLKVSEEDLQLLQPGRSLDAFAQEALAAGVQLVVVTRGAAGVWGWTARHQVRLDPFVVPVVDTVGAGDTFQAALLTWLAENDAEFDTLSAGGLATLSAADLRAALGFAAQAAALTCTRRGADLPRRHELPA